MNSNNPKKTSLTKGMVLILALVLLTAAAIGGTIAWLSAQSPVVTNTFTSAKLFDDPSSDFTLWEHKAVDSNTDGIYELTQEKVLANTYEILPGVDIPKNPTVEVVKLLENGYLYIKVEDNKLPDGIGYSVDPANWTALSGYDGVWVYSGANADSNNVIQAAGSPKSFTATILTNNKLTVDAAYAGAANGETLVFTAYMAQASGNGTNAAEAWANTFG